MKLVSTTIAGPGTAQDLRKALASIAPIVDECIVIWTGSNPSERVEIEAALSAADSKGRIVDWAWRADFGAARQEALDEAAASEADWCLWLDSDEWLVLNGEDIRAVLERTCTTTTAVDMYDAAGTYKQPRAIRFPCTARWVGRTHEYLAVYGPTFERVRFHERPKTSEEINRKRTRDAALLEVETAHAPDAGRWWYYLGDAYEGLDRNDDAISAFSKCAELPGWDEERAWACYRSACILAFKQSKFIEAIEQCARGIARHPGIPELLWVAAVAAQRLGNHAHAVWFAELAKVHGESSKSPWNALNSRRLFRHPSGLREGPASVEIYSLHMLGAYGKADAARQEVDKWVQPRSSTRNSALPRICVTSTGFHVETYVARCIRSVQEQVGVEWCHVYMAVDALTAKAATEAAGKSDSEGDTFVFDYGDEIPRPCLENLVPFWRTLNDDEIIVWLDGDDWLVHPNALKRVAEEHAKGAWVTYGSFIWSNGAIGFAGQVGSNPRDEPWLATHLRSFRAGLVKKIRDDDLKETNGQYAGLVTDQRVMLAVLEMAAERAVLIPEILCAYNLSTSWAAKATPDQVALEHAEVTRIRSFERYARLEQL